MTNDKYYITLISICLFLCFCGRVEADSYSYDEDLRDCDRDSVIASYYASLGCFLGVITLPFDPKNDKNHIRAQKMLDRFDVVPRINQNGAEQIKWLIKNSASERQDRTPSGWMTVFDTTFQPYCSVFPSSVFSEIGVDANKWGHVYPISSDDIGGDPPSCRFNSLFPKSKGLIVCYFAHNHLTSLNLYYRIESLKQPSDKLPMIKVFKSKDITLYRTGHGVLLKKGNRYRWVYHEDISDKLRWATIKDVTVSPTGEIAVRSKPSPVMEAEDSEEPGEWFIFQLEDLTH